MKILNDPNFKAAFSNSTLPLIVYFYAEWCGPCKSVSPIMDKLSESFKGKVDMLKVDVDQSEETIRKYNVMSIPMLLFMDRDKNIVQQTVGQQAESTIINYINQIL